MSIEDVYAALREVYEETNRKEDVVTATFEEFCAYQLFIPQLTSADFFRQNWVIDVHKAPETVQRLVVFLILDAADVLGGFMPPYYVGGLRPMRGAEHPPVRRQEEAPAPLDRSPVHLSDDDERGAEPPTWKVEHGSDCPLRTSSCRSGSRT